MQKEEVVPTVPVSSDAAIAVEPGADATTAEGIAATDANGLSASQREELKAWDGIFSDNDFGEATDPVEMPTP